MEVLFEQNNSSYVGELKAAIQDLAALMMARFPHLKLYSNSVRNQRTFELYETYPESQQKRIFDDVLKYKNIMSSTLIGDEPVSNRSSLWVALKMFGLPFAADDLFSIIDESDVIEIYRYDGIQVFRNLNFHDVCSYELPELFIYPWDQLYYRHESITAEIMRGAMTVFSPEQKSIVDLEHIGEHNICETFSPKRYKLKMRFKYFYPLRNKQNQIEYAIALSKVQIEQMYSNYRDLVLKSTLDQSI